MVNGVRGPTFNPWRRLLGKYSWFITALVAKKAHPLFLLELSRSRKRLHSLLLEAKHPQHQGKRRFGLASYSGFVLQNRGAFQRFIEEFRFPVDLANRQFPAGKSALWLGRIFTQ
jgi:hypothetical protein